MLDCEFDLCIYNNDGKCELDTIQISPLGMCDDCMLPTIDQSTLDTLKDQTKSNLYRTN